MAPPSASTSSPLAALAGSLGAVNRSDLALRRELDSLLQENDPALQAEGLFSLAQRQELAGQVDLAAEIYSTLVGAVRERPLQHRAREHLAALQGHGPLGARFEILSRNFARQASDPALLAGMFVGSALFQAGRLAVLSRLATSPGASLFTRGLGARSLAWGAGFALEVPAFTFTVRGLHESMGLSQEWSRQAVTRDLVSAGLTLFLLKGSAAAGTSLTRRLAAEPSAGIFSRFPTAVIPQAAAFTGIYAAHGLEARLGLRPQTDNGNAIIESLATLLQFHVGGRLLRSVTGGGYERGLEALSRDIGGSGLLRPPRLPGFNLPALRPAFGGAEPSPTRDHILMMSSEGPKKPVTTRSHLSLERESVPNHHVPILARPELFLALRNQFGRLEYEMYYMHAEQGGEAMWAEQSHRITLELLDHLRLVDRFLPNEGDRPTLDSIRGELRWVRHMLAELRQAENLPLASRPDVREFLAALYRVPNKAVNYINNGVARDLEGSLFNARDARLRLFWDVYRFYEVNSDAMDYHGTGEAPLPTRLNVDPETPTRAIHVPNYDFRDEYESPYLEIRGEGRKVVLVGEIPRERIDLSHRHFLELVASDSNHYSKLAGETVIRGRLDRIRVVWQEWKHRTQDAEYLEGYDIAPAEQLVGERGGSLMQELVLNRLRPGGVALLVSRDAVALQRMVQIVTQNDWADVISGSFRGHLPVEVARPDQESGNHVFIRKLAQL